MKFNKMKKHLLLLFTFVFLSSLLNAQDGHKHDRHKKIRAYKVAHITEKLNFTSQEAEKFWPIYNEYNDQMMKLHREERYKIKKRIDKLGGIDKLTEDQSKEILGRITDVETKRNELKSSFFNKVSKFLSYRKILKLEVAEHEFNRKLLRKLRGSKKYKH